MVVEYSADSVTNCLQPLLEEVVANLDKVGNNYFSLIIVGVVLFIGQVFNILHFSCQALFFIYWQ